METTLKAPQIRDEREREGWGGGSLDSEPAPLDSKPTPDPAVLAQKSVQIRDEL